MGVGRGYSSGVPKEDRQDWVVGGQVQCSAVSRDHGQAMHLSKSQFSHLQNGSADPAHPSGWEVLVGEGTLQIIKLCLLAIGKGEKMLRTRGWGGCL